MVFPVLQVPGFEHVTDQPEKPLIVDFLRQDPGHYLVAQRPEAIGDIALDEPCGPFPGFADLPQCGMASAAFAEPMGLVRELRLVIRLQDQAYHLADQLAGPRWQSQGPQLPVLFRDVDAAGRGEPVPLMPHQPDDLVDLPLGHAIGGFFAGTRRHRPVVRVDAAVQQVQIPVEHLPVKLLARQALPAALAENAQYHFGFLHYASLMVINRSSPVPLRPVVRLSRSPDWADVTPPTTYGHSVAIGLASLRRSHVRNCCTYRARLRRPVRLLKCPDRALLLCPGGLQRASRYPVAGAGTQCHGL